MQTEFNVSNESFDREGLDLYLKDVANYELLTADEEKTLTRLAQAGDNVARDRMISSNLRLVVKMASKYRNRSGSVDFLDLISEGNLGLIHAIEKFDPEKGFRFSTYAVWWIKQAIERGISNKSRTIRLPNHIVKELSSYLRANKELSNNDNQGDVSTKDIAKHVNVKESRVTKVLNSNNSIVSIHTLVSEDNSNLSIEEVVPNAVQINQEEEIQQDQTHVLLTELLYELSERERDILMLRYGLLGHNAATLDEISGMYKITRERIRQIQIKSLTKLRHIVEDRGLEKETLLSMFM
ncbi:sigma-70 family RNA polymerase sigma factor [Vibrio sp. SS-MA-C1-2]|uniref:sigma-70 family RNA polymerase sigma factor n=1 Tax=Vibrio sp. SS-MA-C1-2 TaxID=2908646 RepID=UPI001F161D4C|nr:sigma-70 family RNA polymerase sigma factor [Vibrio sp. SS-MA-C1-2]UJF17218.1 sigma-70 family RNA polymerase sigma factor [Vibrio sp. SS-MA-C1-2]